MTVRQNQQNDAQQRPRSAWSKSSLSAWRNPGSLAILRAHSKDSDQTWWVHRQSSMRAQVFFFLLRLINSMISNVMYNYFFIKFVRWSENSVRFEKSYGNWLPDGPDSVRFHLTVWDYKNLTWVWGADRTFRPEGHCLASRGFAEWCKTSIPRDGILYPHRTLMFDSFSFIPFYFTM